MSDTDGYVSAAVLINYLNTLFPSWTRTHIIYEHQLGKEHGIHADWVPEGVKLVICPDSSSNAIEECEKLYKRGIDVIIADHHESSELPPHAIVVNNQTCDYPNKALCGGAIVWKICKYIDTLLLKNNSEEFLDLVATSLIADVMDSRPLETRRLINKGLSNINNAFLENFILKQAYSMKGKITPIGVAFYIVPYINAITRVGTQEEKQLIFEALLDFKATEWIPSTKRGHKDEQEQRFEQAIRVCTSVKRRQSDIQDAAMFNVEERIVNENLLENKILCVTVEDGEIDPGLTGLVANKLMGKYRHPVLLLRDCGEDYSGSGRNVGHSEFENFKDYINNTKLCNFAEGHQSAFGTSFPKDSLKKFIEISNKELAKFDFQPLYDVDYIYNGSNFPSSSIREIADFDGIWGTFVEEPYIAVENIRVSKDNCFLMGAKKNTIKINLNNGVTCMIFNTNEETFNSLTSSPITDINIVGRCSINVWNDLVTPQILIEDFEIKGRRLWYF